MPGYTWKNVNQQAAETVKKYLEASGGTLVQVTSPHESWRIHWQAVTITYYVKGTLYSTPIHRNPGEVNTLWTEIQRLVGQRYSPPSRQWLIGCDETGKGEVLGPVILAAAIFPAELFEKLDQLIGPADTKNRQQMAYWEKLFQQIIQLRPGGFDFAYEVISSKDLDLMNQNQLLELAYRRLCQRLLKSLSRDNVRLVLDDFGVGPILKSYFKNLRRQGMEVIVATQSEDHYLETKLASILAKRFRESIMSLVNADPAFQLADSIPGTGNTGDPQTLAWLQRWYLNGQPWPWFVKQSFQTVRKMEGKTSKLAKISPTFHTDYLTTDAIERFDQELLPIQTLSITCPVCGTIERHLVFRSDHAAPAASSQLYCTNPVCGANLARIEKTLRFYCGDLVVTSAVLWQQKISTDLTTDGIFENFTIVLTPHVYREATQTIAGRTEIAALEKMARLGRIQLEPIVDSSPKIMSPDQSSMESEIIVTARHRNAILLTTASELNAEIPAQDIFIIFFRD